MTPIGITVFSSVSTTDLDNGNNKLVSYSIDFASTSEVYITAGVMPVLGRERYFVLAVNMLLLE